MKNLLRTFINLTLIACILLFCMCACGKTNSIELTEEQKVSMWNQYLEDHELEYQEYLESKWFVSGEILDIETQEDRTYVYAYVADALYAPLKGRAYMLSASNLPVKLTLETDTWKLLQREYPKDGSFYDSSLKELFTKKAYRRCKDYDSTNLNSQVEDQVKSEWNVAVDDNYQLHMDEQGNYEIIVIDHDGSTEHPFESHVEDKGTLSPLE